MSRTHEELGRVPDYGRPVEFSIFPTLEVDQLPDLFRMVDAADGGGLDLVGIQGHPYQRRFVDAYVLAGAVLERTRRLRAFTDVANLPLRSPAMIAKTAASLDLLSGGRFELGLGVGAFWEAMTALGVPKTSRAEAGALREAVEVIRLLWSDQRSVRFQGRHFSLAGTKPGRRPAHEIGIWLGVGGPRLLEFTGRAADCWVPRRPTSRPRCCRPCMPASTRALRPAVATRRWSGGSTTCSASSRPGPS